MKVRRKIIERNKIYNKCLHNEENVYNKPELLNQRTYKVEAFQNE